VFPNFSLVDRRLKKMTRAAASKLGPYEIVVPIGAGGVGEVHRASDPLLGREAGIKF